jgi:hypothetical protein
MYRRTFWKNDVYNPPDRVNLTDLGGGVFQVSKAGTHMEVGTPQDKDHFNPLEHGMVDVTATTALMLNMIRQLQEDTGVERHTVSLTNTDKYPFNNSAVTVALDERRNNLDYSVEAEVLSRTGGVENVEVYDKQLNGFKVKFNGSGTAATIRLKITGGIT